MKKNTDQKESQVQLFKLFSVEELETRLEFKRKRRNPRGVPSVNYNFVELIVNPCA